MGMVALLLPAQVGELSLGPEVAARLTALGVTFAALLADDEGVAVILDGSRFDPARSAAAALAALGGGPPSRTLTPLAQISVSSA
jgi:hypothetical protein